MTGWGSRAYDLMHSVTRRMHFVESSRMKRVYPTRSGSPSLEGLAADANAGVLLAANGPDIVGIAMVGFDQETSAVSIGGMWVRPASRRLGVGRALVKHALDWGIEHGAGRARLAVTIGNEPAEQLYTTAGFTPTGETEPLREGSDLVVTWLETPL